MNDKYTSQYCYKYPRMMVAIDVLIFTILDNKLKVLLLKRPNIVKDEAKTTTKDYYALLGGIVRFDECFEDAVQRILTEKAHINAKENEIYLEQLFTFGKVDRDPRDRVISVAYYTLVKSEKIPKLSDEDLIWTEAYNLPSKLVIDHAEILRVGLDRLVSKIEYNTIPFSLIGDTFTISQLREIYDALLNKTSDDRLDPGNFQKKFIKRKLIVPTNEFMRFEGQTRRPAKIFKRNCEIGKTLPRSLFD